MKNLSFNYKAAFRLSTIILLLVANNINAQNKYGFVNESGQYVIQPQFKQAKNFSEGLAAVKVEDSKGQHFTYIDKTGKIAIEKSFISANNFHEGFAVVSYMLGFSVLMNKQGEYIYTKPTVEFMGIMVEDRISYRRKDKFGFFNSEGKMVSKHIYDEVRQFKNGYARVKLNDKWGFINKEGVLVIQCIYDSSDNFENNFAVVSKNSKFYKIDTNGTEKITLPKQINQRELIIEYTEYEPFRFSEGLGRIRDDEYDDVFKK